MSGPNAARPAHKVAKNALKRHLAGSFTSNRLYITTPAECTCPNWQFGQFRYPEKWTGKCKHQTALTSKKIVPASLKTAKTPCPPVHLPWSGNSEIQLVRIGSMIAPSTEDRRRAAAYEVTDIEITATGRIVFHVRSKGRRRYEFGISEIAQTITL